LCGGTGSWSEPYRSAGYDVRVITLPSYDVLKWPLALAEMKIQPENVYGILAAPPCTKFSKAAWQVKKTDRDFEEGMRCVRACLDCIWWVQEHGAQLKFWALENPQGYLYNFLGFPAYWFQPWWFGERDGRATKRTALWGYFKEPRRSVRKRTIAFISPHSRPAGDGRHDRERINKQWGKMSVEDRARTSSHFAKAFFKANQ
jgi:hypothetical protein